MEAAANVAKKNKLVNELYEARSQQFREYAQTIGLEQKELENFRESGRYSAAKVWEEDLAKKGNHFLAIVHACKNDGEIIMTYVIDGKYNQSK